jgi:predicted dienelactone hydrolase
MTDDRDVRITKYNKLPDFTISDGGPARFFRLEGRMIIRPYGRPKDHIDAVRVTHASPLQTAGLPLPLALSPNHKHNAGSDWEDKMIMRLPMVTSMTLLLGIIALFAPMVVAGDTAGATPPDPLSAGPFPVGVTTTVFVDSSRTDNLTKQPRTLVTEIWYPATDEARQMPKNKFSDFIPGGVTPEIGELIKKTYKVDAAEVDKLYWNEAHRNAPLRDGRFPLIVFSHGNGGSRHQNTFWYDYVASHGYIIVSPDHTGNARWTIIDGKVITSASGERLNSAKDRPLDVCFLLDQMIRWDKGGDPRFAGRVDTDHAAIAGMSFGSFTAHWASDRDPRFKAVVAMSGAPPMHTNLTVPSLRMLGTEDRTLGTLGNGLIRANHTTHTGPAFLLELKNGGHYSFTDVFKVNKNFGDGIGAGKRRDTNEPFEFTSMELTYQIVNSYSVAFLGYFLKGQKEYWMFLSENHWPDTVIWDVKNAPRNVDRSESPFGVPPSGGSKSRDRDFGLRAESASLGEKE